MKRPYSFLLGALLVTMVAAPVSAVAGKSGDLLEWFLFSSLAAAACGEGSGRQRTWLFAILGSAGALMLAGRLLHIQGASSAAAVVWILLAIVAAFKAFRFALGGGEIEIEHICAALSVYMLAGLFFGLAYWRLETALPSAFTMDCRAQQAGTLDLPAAIYLSFVTIATVGYGEIVPSNPVARGLVTSEAVLGQFYMVVLVARLVSLYSQRPGGKE